MRGVEDDLALLWCYVFGVAFATQFAELLGGGNPRLRVGGDEPNQQSRGIFRPRFEAGFGALDVDVLAGVSGVAPVRSEFVEVPDVEQVGVIFAAELRARTRPMVG